MDDTTRQLLDYCGDIWVALKGIAATLDAWNAQPRTGRITLGQEQLMTMVTEIPAEDVPARVDWYDRLGTQIDHQKTDTTWSAEDENGAASAAVQVNPDLDADTSDETATVHFLASSGQFMVVATTPGEGGETVRAESQLYSITPGAPAVGVITLAPS